MAKNIIFILPKNTKRTLDDDGWEFHSDYVIPNIALKKLLEAYNLEFMEEYLEIKKYENADIDMSVIFTDKKITEIYLRTSLEKDMFANQLLELLKDDEVEIFIPDTEVRSTGIQFHATPSEIVEVLAQFRANFACNVAVTTFPVETVRIYETLEEVDWQEIIKLASDIKKGASVYLSKKSFNPPPSSRYFLGYNLGSLVVDLGKMVNLSLQESSIGCKSENPDDLVFAKKAINLFRKITNTGAYVFNPEEDGDSFYKNHRYSQGAKDLYDKGYEIKPIAGCLRYKLP